MATSNTAETLSLRQRTRKAVQAEIARHALELFTEQGFDATTVEQIADAAGISQRSFFRYFATKEDVVIGDPAPYGEILLAAVQACPAGTPPWTALRAALGRLIDVVHADPVSSLQASALMISTPGLRARHLEKQILWEQLLVPDIAARLHGPAAQRTLQAHAIVASALSCLDAALNAWSGSTRTDRLEDVLDLAITAVQQCS